MRAFAIVTLVMGLTGCTCSEGQVSRVFGRLLVVQLASSGEETLTRDAVVSVPSTFMETESISQVPVRNIGFANITIASVTRLEGDESLSLQDAEGKEVLFGTEAQLQVRFSPAQAADATALHVNHRAKFSLALSNAAPGEEEIIIELQAAATARDCYVPAVIDFGRVPLRHAVTNTVHLEGDNPITLGGAMGAEVFEFDVKNSMQWNVRFTPLEERAYEATVNAQRGPSCPQAQVRLKGVGDEQGLSWNPSQLDFGRLPLGIKASQTITFVNQANVSLSLNASVSSLDFALESPIDSLQANSTTSIEVSCSPRTLGPLNDVLNVNIGTEPAFQIHIPLTCFGGGPRIQIDPTPLYFGQVPVGGAGPVARRRLIIRNVGTAPAQADDSQYNLKLGRSGQLPWFGIVPKNANTRIDEFNIVLRSNAYNNAVGLPALNSRDAIEFEVTLVPTSAGTREAELWVYSNDAKEPTVKIPITAAPRLPENCQLEVSPEGANFGPAPRGVTLTRDFTLTNTKTTPGNLCLISGIEMGPGSDLAFKVIDPIVPSLLLGAGQSRTVRLQATVDSNATLGEYLKGTLRMNVSGENVLREYPVDLQVSRCLVVEPSVVNLGLVQQHCTSGPQNLTLYNVCAVPITWRGASGLALPFKMTGANPGITLSGGSQTQFKVTVAPSTVGPLSQAIQMDTEEVGVLQSQEVTLHATADETGLQQDAFTQAEPEVDILLVIDNSCSMGEEQAALATNFAAFISSAAQSPGDWHIGATTTDIFANRGMLLSTPSNPKTLTPTTPEVATLFAQKVQVGTGGSGFEQPFEAISMAVTEPNLTGPNAGFFRPEAALAVVVVTDALEQSPNQVGAYLATMRALKKNRPELFSLSVVGPLSEPSTTCVTEGEVDPGRYVEAVDATGGVKADICTQNWAFDLETISRSVFGSRRNFVLSSLARGKTEIVVTVNGDEVPADAWQFDASNNAVVFNTAPQSGDAISIGYRTACF